MIRRIPLWATLLPLVLGVAIWALVWRGYARDLEADLAAVLPAGTAVEVGGFPYRLEARLGRADIVRGDVAIAARLRADELTVNRVPWQRDRQVVNLAAPVAELALEPLAGATLKIEASEAQASLRLAGSGIGRLSIVWEDPRFTTGLLPVRITAGRAELHLREPPVPIASRPQNPRLPTVAQLVLSGTEVQLGASDPLAVRMEVELTAGRPLRSFVGWAAGGTAEIGTATLADKTGEIARLNATLVPDGAGALRIAGTIETVCPANVRAAIAGQPAVSERRLRSAEKVVISGILPGGILAAPRDPAKPPAPVRAQQPPCPRLR